MAELANSKYNVLNITRIIAAKLRIDEIITRMAGNSAPTVKREDMGTYATNRPADPDWWKSDQKQRSFKYGRCSEEELLRFTEQRGFGPLCCKCKDCLVRLLRRRDNTPSFHRFIELPPELRNRILGFHFAFLKSRNVCLPLVQPPITLVSRGLRVETLPKLHGLFPLKLDLARLVFVQRNFKSLQYDHSPDPYDSDFCRRTDPCWIVAGTCLTDHSLPAEVKNFLAVTNMRYIRTIIIRFALETNLFGKFLYTVTLTIPEGKKHYSTHIEYTVHETRREIDGLKPTDNVIWSFFHTIVKEIMRSYAKALSAPKTRHFWSLEMLQALLIVVEELAKLNTFVLFADGLL